MNISAMTKVRDIALEFPQATRVLEKLKIDYCCGGDQPLGDACATAGVEMENVMKLIEQAGKTLAQGDGALDLKRASLSELIGYILDKHHVYTKDEMARLEPLAEKVLTAHGENHSELLAIRDLLRELFTDLRPHMFKEEQILFPFVIEMEKSRTQNRRPPFAPFGTVNNPIRMMLMEHDTVGELLRELRKLSGDYQAPPDACISYKTFYEALEAFEQDLHQHIHLENNLLFPKAIELETEFVANFAAHTV
jgi:regulator of cell morphogenesis and NO signaling